MQDLNTRTRYQGLSPGGGGCLLPDLLHRARDSFSGSRVHLLGGPASRQQGRHGRDCLVAENLEPKRQVGFVGAAQFRQIQEDAADPLMLRPIATIRRMIATKRKHRKFAGSRSAQAAKRRFAPAAFGNRAQRLSQRRGRGFLPSRRPQRIGSLSRARVHRPRGRARAWCAQTPNPPIVVSVS